ncbi:MAG: hypothetical protein MUO80_04405 [Dehalococcoidia bacterium]|nr:hypothetical protein [Dehalococcoidia bacterium]
MSYDKYVQTIVDLKKELACIESNSQQVGRHFEILQREAEFLKMEFLKYSLEKQRTAAARQRGFALLIRDRKKIGIGLAVTVGGSILGGLLAKDKDAALNAGLSGFNGVLQGFGETRWAVSLQKELVIVPYDAITAAGTWATLESLVAAIDDLETETLQGKRLGTIDNIIQTLQQSEGKLIYIALPK